MRRMIGTTLAIVLGVVFLVPTGWAQDTAPEGAEAPEATEVTQLQLAEMLVNVLGLSRFISGDPGSEQIFAALMTNGIKPQDGFDPTAVVTKATLARLVVQAMGRADEIENPDDPQAWVDYLAANNVPINTIGEAMVGLEPLAEPVVDNVFRKSASADPLYRQVVFGKPSERQFGVDIDEGVRPYGEVVPMETIEAVIAAVTVPPKKTEPETGDGGDA